MFHPAPVRGSVLPLPFPFAALNSMRLSGVASKATYQVLAFGSFVVSWDTGVSVAGISFADVKVSLLAAL